MQSLKYSIYKPLAYLLKNNFTKQIATFVRTSLMNQKGNNDNIYLPVWFISRTYPYSKKEKELCVDVRYRYQGQDLLINTIGEWKDTPPVPRKSYGNYILFLFTLILHLIC